MDNQMNSKFEKTLAHISSRADAVKKAHAKTRARLISAWKKEIRDSFTEVLKACNGPRSLFLVHGSLENLLAWPDKEG